MTFAIQTHNLTKRYPRTRDLLPFPTSASEGTLAVDRVSFSVRRGEIFGLVGPNGAGKTTLVKMLSTLILPTSGTAQVNGYDLSGEERIKSSIGLVTANERSFYPRLSCRENLHFYAGLYDLPSARAAQRIDRLGELLDLHPFLDKRYDTCSTGMKHRLALARALLNEPSVLFLDEPTRSLDPVAAARFHEAVYGLARREGRTLFLVTHNLDEAAGLCDRVAVMVEGRLRVTGSPEALRRLLAQEARCCVEVRDFADPVAERLRALEGVQELDVQADGASGRARVTLRLRERRRDLPAVIHAIGEGGAAVEDLSFSTASWESVLERLEDAPVAAPPGVPAASSLTLPGRTLFPPSGPVATGRRARLLRGLRKPLLFLRRDLQSELSYRFAFVLQFLSILFSIASFFFVAQLVGEGVGDRLAAYGGDYFSFVLVGIAFAGYQGVAMHTFAGVIRSAQVAGTLEALLVTPTRIPTILLSSSLWSFLFTTLRVVLYLVAGWLVFGADLSQVNLLSALVVLVLTVVALSSIGILSASFIMVFKRGNPINFLIGSLSTLLSGVYYPVTVLPAWLQVVARFFPLTYSLEAMRRAVLVGAPLSALLREVLLLAAFAGLLLPLGLLAFRYAVRQARRDGSLAQF